MRLMKFGFWADGTMSRSFNQRTLVLVLAFARICFLKGVVKEGRRGGGVKKLVGSFFYLPCPDTGANTIQQYHIHSVITFSQFVPQRQPDHSITCSCNNSIKQVSANITEIHLTN